MYKIVASNRFLKDLALLKKRSIKDFSFLQEFIKNLAEHVHGGIPKKHRPHKLSGNFDDYWECHVKPDLLFIWNEDDEIQFLELVRTGSHSDLF